MYISSVENIKQGPNEKVTYCADFSNRFRAGETFEGQTPVAEQVDGVGLNVTNVSVLTEAFSDRGKTVAPFKGIVFTVEGATLGTGGADAPYVISVRCPTNRGGRREMRCRITATIK